jgi:hypothetical protein
LGKIIDVCHAIGERGILGRAGGGAGEVLDGKGGILVKLLGEPIRHCVTTVPESPTSMDAPSILSDAGAPEAALSIVLGDVGAEDAEEDMVVAPFRDWPNTSGSHELSPSIADLPVVSGSGAEAKAVGSVDVEGVGAREADDEARPL